MKIKVYQKFKDLIPKLSKEEFSGLKESILNEGCRNNLVLWNNVLIDGHNRFEICNKHGIKFETISKEFENENEVKIWIIQNQFNRRNLDIFTRGELALKLEGLFEGRQGGDRKSLKFQGDNIITLKKGKTRDIIAKKAGVSGMTINKIKRIRERAPEKIEEIKQGKVSITKVDKDIRRKDKKQEFLANDTPLPKGKFNVIYADPPWRYDHTETKSRAIENKYPTMTLEDIKNIEVHSDKACVLFLWTTAPKIKEALEVMQSWGFSYRTQGVWDKETIGMGYWFRGQHEILLVGIKGNISPPFPENRFSSVYRKKKSVHSKKPKFYYTMIEKMFPKGKYLELFSRNKRKNWTMWGNEVK